MDRVQNVKDILEAIKSVRIRAEEAVIDGDLPVYSRLMLDILALERCLEIESGLLIEQAA